MNTMTRAHEIKREAAKKWNCQESEIVFGICLKMAHEESKMDNNINMFGTIGRDVNFFFIAMEKAVILKTKKDGEWARVTGKYNSHVVHIEAKYINENASSYRQRWVFNKKRILIKNLEKELSK